MFNTCLTCPTGSRIIVERRFDDTWVASLPGVPNAAAPAKYPIAAIQNLIERSGEPGLKVDSLRPIEGRMNKNYLEFKIERSDWRPTILAN